MSRDEPAVPAALEDLAERAIRRGYSLRRRRRIEVAIPAVLAVVLVGALVLPAAMRAFEVRRLAPDAPGRVPIPTPAHHLPRRQGTSRDTGGGNESRSSGHAAIGARSLPSDRFSPRAGRIAFVSSRDADAEIYVMEADGTRQRRLTTSVGDDVSPAWSPDGARIAFASSRSGASGIYTMTADGGHLRRVAAFGGEQTAADPAWSPDGTRIAFTFWEQPRGTPGARPARLRIVDADGAHMRTVNADAASNASTPSWSPDGRQIAYSATQGGDKAYREVHVVNLATSRVRSLGAGVAPAWSPDGRRIAFVRDDLYDMPHAVIVMNADGSAARVVTETADWYNRVSWSPDGDELVVDRDPDGHAPGFGCDVRTPQPRGCVVAGPQASSIWVVRADGSHVHRLTGSTDDFSPAFGAG